LPIDDIRVECGQRGAIGGYVHAAGEQRSNFEKRRDPRFALLRPTAPRGHDHDHGSAIWAEDASELNRQLFGRGSRNVGAACENGCGLGERVNEHARADTGQIVQPVVHRSDDAEVSTAATQRPKQLLFAVGLGDNEAPIRENDLGGDEIVERKSEAADQRSVTAAQGESRHADATVRARYGRNA